MLKAVFMRLILSFMQLFIKIYAYKQAARLTKCQSGLLIIIAC